jgi:DNA-binding protein Fis
MNSSNLKRLQQATVRRRNPRINISSKQIVDDIKTDIDGNLPKGYRSTYRIAFEQWEKDLLTFYLRLAGGNQCKAARELGIHRNTMTRRLRANGFTDQDLRDIKNNFKDPLREKLGIVYY